MNQEKIGNFIASCRAEIGFTQASVAEKLGITDRAVSKWENGKSMPDASIMLDLCNLLGINVNELLSGERLNTDNYKEMAEENLFRMQKQEKINNKKLLSLEVVIGYMSSISFIVLIFAASFAVVKPAWQIIMIIISVIIFVVGMVCCLRLEHDTGYYECPNCGKRYIPSMKTIVFAPHKGMSRKMRCPGCNTKGYCKKVLTK